MDTYLITRVTSGLEDLQARVDEVEGPVKAIAGGDADARQLALPGLAEKLEKLRAELRRLNQMVDDGPRDDPNGESATKAFDLFKMNASRIQALVQTLFAHFGELQGITEQDLVNVNQELDRFVSTVGTSYLEPACP